MSSEDREDLKRQLKVQTSKLRESEARYKDAARIANLGHWTFDEEKDCIDYCSEELARIHGVSPNEYLSMVASTEKDIERAHPEDREMYGKAIKFAQANASPYDVEYRIIRPTGEVRYIREIGEPICDETGKLIRSQGTLQDITDQKLTENSLRQSKNELEDRVNERTLELTATAFEQKRAEAQLIESELLLRRASGMAKIGYWVWDEIEDSIITCSSEIPVIIGVSMDEYLEAGSSLEGEARWIYPDDQNRYLEAHSTWQETARSKGRDTPVFELEYRILRPDKEIRYVREQVEPTFNADGLFVRSFGIVHDITEHKRIQSALLESEDYLAKMARAIEQTSEMIVLFDSDDRIVFANKAWRELNTAVEWSTRPGVTFEQHIRALSDGGFVPEAIGREEEWIAERLQTHCHPPGPFELSRQDNKWVLINEKKLEDGSTILVISDITDMKHKEAALQESEQLAKTNAQKAEAANQAKSNFLATMSHEIRTPLNGVLGLAQLLISSDLDQDQRKKVDTILSSGQTLLAIINDVLDMSRIEAGGIELEEKAFNLNILVSMIATPFQSLADDKGLKLVVNDNIEHVSVIIGDPVRLRQILWNLLSNAIKFTDTGTITLTIDARTDERSTDTNTKDRLIRFTVKDTGVGIAPDRVDRVFEAFTQEDSSITRKFGGTGLGLSIVKQLTELMGGTITADSTLGTGTTFEVRLPFDEASKEETDALILKSIQNNIQKIEPLNVLIAEDNEVNAIIARAFLEKFGHTVKHVTNGKLVTEAADEGWADLILMDIHMPEMNGIDATRLIRKSRKGSNLPIVGLTAEAFAERHAQFREAGMDGVLTKPFTEQQLAETLATYRWCRREPEQDTTSLSIYTIASDSQSPEQKQTKPSTDDSDLAPRRNEPVGDEVALTAFRKQINSDTAITLLKAAQVSLGDSMKDLRLGIDEKNSTLIRDASHTIKGSSGSMFAVRVSNIAATIEQKSSDIEAVHKLMPDIEEAARDTAEWWESNAN
jgi:PAS domain S-box-containing protein